MTSSAGTTTAAFVAIARVDELPLNLPRGFVEAGRELCLLRTDDEVLAFEDRCPHRGHPLSEAKCDDGVLRCALHGWEFSIPDGAAVSPRAPFGLEFYPTRVIDDVVEVEL
jgi:nitrite reductase/ring-hydroxylating ferredoxin subunit